MDSCHSYCGNGGLTPPVLSTVEERWAFNTSVRRAVGRRIIRPLCRGVASSEAEMTYPLEGRFATLERGGDALRDRGSRGEPSSEAEMSDPLEGRFATLERGGDCPAGSRGMRMGRTLGFFESFVFSRLEGGRGPSWAQLP